MCKQLAIIQNQSVEKEMYAVTFPALQTDLFTNLTYTYPQGLQTYKYTT